MSTETTVIAGTVDEYVIKLSKLGKPVLQARIAKLKAKLKHFASISKTGKLAAAGKPGPKTKQQLAGAVRFCQNALTWHESALEKAGTVTAGTATPVRELSRRNFGSLLPGMLKRGDEDTKAIVDHLFKAIMAYDKGKEMLELFQISLYGKPEK